MLFFFRIRFLLGLFKGHFPQLQRLSKLQYFHLLLRGRGRESFKKYKQRINTAKTGRNTLLLLMPDHLWLAPGLWCLGTNCAEVLFLHLSSQPFFYMLFNIQLRWPSSVWTVRPLGLVRVQGLTQSFFFPCSACYSCACSSCLHFFWKRPQWEAWVLWHMAGISLRNYLSTLLICFEWSWPCSKRACGFPHLWLFAVVSALSESPSVQEEPEQFSHSIFSPPLLFPWHSPGFHLQSMLFFKCTLKTLCSPGFFSHWMWKED